MTLKDFSLYDNNHFVAMEYHKLILNRTFIVLLTNDYLIGLQANGMVSIQGGVDVFTQEISKSYAIRGDLANPFSYVKDKYIRAIESFDLLDGSILRQSKTNFMIHKTDIKNVYFDASKKWGMGYYPHDGKVYVETMDNKKREFIILGEQSGEVIAQLILKMKEGFFEGK
jgi:hypothetical protein